MLRRKREMVGEKVTGQYGGDEGSGNFQLHCAGNGSKLRQMSLQNPTLKLLQMAAQKDFFHSNPQGAIRQKSIDR